MRGIVTDPARTRVIATFPAELVGEAIRNPSWQGLALFYAEGEVYEGSDPPAGMTPVDRANPGPVPSAETLYAYANRRRREITEGVGGNPGRWVDVTLSAGTYPFPLDATTRAALGDGAFQTTLAGGHAYAIDSWLLPIGAFIRLDAADIMTAARAVEAAFQAVFSAQKRAFAAISDGTATTQAQIDAILASEAP